MRLYVQTEGEEQPFPIVVEPHDTIASVKAKIQMTAGINPAQQVLSYADFELADQETLSSANIQHKSTIHARVMAEIENVPVPPDPYMATAVPDMDVESGSRRCQLHPHHSEELEPPTGRSRIHAPSEPKRGEALPELHGDNLIMMKPFERLIKNEVGGVSKEVSDLRTAVQRVEEKVATTDEKLESTDKSVKDLSIRVEKLEMGNGSSQQKVAPAVSTNHAASTPYELRTIAIMGNLGWDTPKALLLERAQAVLQEAGVDPAAYTNLVPTTGKDGTGSMAQLCFSRPDLLQSSRLAVLALGKSFSTDGQVRSVWLEAKKERAELRPSRIVHRMEDILTDIEQGRPDTVEIEKVMNGKYIKVGGRRAGYIYKGEWKWTAWATERYNEETRDMAKAYAEGDVLAPQRANVQIISINAGRTAGTHIGLQAVLGVFTASSPWWSVVFVSEADGFQDDRQHSHANHICFRHFPGAGSWAMLFVIRNDMQDFIQSRTWCGRCGAVHLLHRGTHNLMRLNL